MTDAAQTALIVGGSGGIGSAIVRAMIQRGWTVAATSRDWTASPSTAVGAMRGEKVTAVDCDVTHVGSVKRAVSTACESLGGLNAVIYAVGHTESRPFLEEDEAYRQKTIDVNLTGALRVATAVLPHLLGRKGSLVFIASDAARVGTSRLATYAAAKAGLLGLARSLALEYAGKGVRVNAVCPGVTVTTLAESLDDGGTTERITRRVPMKRAASPEEIAAVVAFLCSPEASYVTGQTWSVNGGLVTS